MLTWDEPKRQHTLAERGLDFADAARMFDGPSLQRIDQRRDYGEERWLGYGLLRGRMVVLVWTWRGGARHIISMRKANEREQQRYREQLG